MSYRVVVVPGVSRMARGWGLSRGAVVSLWNKLRTVLENEESADQRRKRRDESDPDHRFVYEVIIRDEDRRHRLRFGIDDRQATGYLFVVDVTHTVEE